MARRSSSRQYDQGKYWLLTIPQEIFTPYPVPGCSWIRGQLESGTQNGYLHWQIFVCTDRKRRKRWILDTFGRSEGVHAELTRSEAAESYVFKEDTRVPNTQFEFGAKPMQRNSQRDWERIWELAKTGQYDKIDPDVRVPHYRYSPNNVGLCEASMRTIVNQLEWSELATFFGVELVVESRGGLGRKREWELILSVPNLNSGWATTAKSTLLSMNLEVVSRLAICSDGLIDIQYTWKLRDQVFPWQRRKSG